jgi:ubiquinone/menaquinone biosynthesis C-methylase UbiE
VENYMPELTVDGHYAVGGIQDRILRALKALGKDIGNLTASDLSPIDEFHIRGREATHELAERTELGPGLNVLDVGCGLGGSVRHLAVEHQCHVTGIDLTDEYIKTAVALSRLVGLEKQVEFHTGSALKMPFGDAAFDVVWTEHAQMNIEDKAGLYGEIARVLKPGGRLVFHDIFQGPGGEPHFPVPWAEDRSISFLISPDSARDVLEKIGLEIRNWEDKGAHSLAWFETAAEKLKSSGPPSLGTHLLMGETAKDKFVNVVRNLRDERIAVLQAVLVKR